MFGFRFEFPPLPVINIIFLLFSGLCLLLSHCHHDRVQYDDNILKR